MNQNTYPEHKNLYRLPWSTNDNPIGWLEVTDTCNLTCHGCYRLVRDGHKPLAQLKKEVQFLKKWRNCDNISLAGGEPILHPQIIELVQFIYDQGMKPMLLTNGFALNQKLLLRLKKAGLAGISFHIDTTQTRPEAEFKKKPIESELLLNPLREKFAKMVKNVGGLTASFGITVTSQNFREVPDFIQWAIDHIDYVHGVSLITFRGMPLDGSVEYYNDNGDRVSVKAGTLGYAVEHSENEKISSEDVYALIKSRFPAYEATAYLGGTADHTSFKWLLGNIIVNNRGKFFGAYGKKMMEICQFFYHFFKGSYVIHTKTKIGKKIFLLSPFDLQLRKAFWAFLKYALLNPARFFYPVRALGIGMIQAPDVLPDGTINMCDDCPDMCVHDGKLVNSCRLDECRFYGSLLHLHMLKDQPKENVKEGVAIMEDK